MAPIFLILTVLFSGLAALLWQRNNRLKRENQHLSRDKYLLDFLMEHLPMSVYFKDKESRFIKVSRYMLDRFRPDLHLNDFVGKTDFDIQAETHAREAFEDEQVIVKTLRPKIDFVERELTPEGIERWVSTTKMPLLDTDGEVAGTFGVSKDITEIKRQHHELEISTAKIRIQNVLLQEQREELATQNEELTQTQEEISAQRDIVAQQNQQIKEAAEMIQAQSRSIQERNETLEIEIASRTKDIIEYNQQLEQFAFITAHNLRAPVARILGLGNVLELPDRGEEEQNLILKKLLGTVNELDQVIRDLNIILEIKKNVTQAKSPVLLEDEFEKVISNLRSEIEASAATIDHNFSEAPVVDSFMPYVDSILFNLVSNAIKYRDPERPLYINVVSKPLDDHVVLSISDNGLGIDLTKYGNLLGSLYKRFHTHTEGKGMGLYLVKSQITTLGGYLDVKSEQGKGTEICIFFKQEI